MRIKWSCLHSTMFLYSSDCWAVTKRDAYKIDALDQWCLWKLLGIIWYYQMRKTRWGETDNQATAPFGHCPSTAFLHVWPHCVNARRNRCQDDLNSFLLGELEETNVLCTSSGAWVDKWWWGGIHAQSYTIITSVLMLLGLPDYWLYITKAATPQ